MSIGDTFHPDSSYYIHSASELFTQGWRHVVLASINNELFVLWIAILQLLSDSNLLIIAFNIIFGCLLVLEAVKLFRWAGLNEETAFKGGLLFSLLPYHIHLSVHILKDIPFLLLALICFRRALERRSCMGSLLPAALMVFNRLYFGLFLIIMLLLLGLMRRLSMKWLLMAWLVLVSLAVVVGSEGIVQRREEVFEGRELFRGVEISRPKSPVGLLAYLSVAPLKNLVIPSVINVSSGSDLAFAVHCLFYQGLTVTWLMAGRRKGVSYSPRQQAMLRYGIVSYMALVGFADAATPGVGPLMRYREIAMIVLAVTIFSTMRRKGNAKDSSLGHAWHSRPVRRV
ncbi:MAG: hypothetical protein NVSMB27_41110 [Ktedonobacteraceae bacterium]